MRSATAPTPSPSSSPPVSEAAGGSGPAADGAGLGIYVHWPFCLSKCPYCDFNSLAQPSLPDAGRWRSALLGQLEHFRRRLGRCRVDSIFFGGGTPSLMPSRLAGDLLDAIAGAFSIAPDVEVTLEANPTSVEAGRLGDFRSAGVNRLSLGVQALDDRALAFLGRRHSADEARAAVAMAARLMPRLSIDLIYARPGQAPAAWRRELGDAIALGAGHLSAYQLTIEPGTPFHRRGVAEADEDTAADLFEVTREVLAAAGLPAYEIANHARPGEECRHNLAIWQGGDYLGLGPGAHGRIGRSAAGGDGGAEAHAGIRDPAAWLAAIEAGGDGLAERFSLSRRERAEELLILGLRLVRGIDRRQFRDRTGLDPAAAVDRAALAMLCDAGFLAVDAGSLRATAAGRLRLDAVLARLLAEGPQKPVKRRGASEMTTAPPSATCSTARRRSA